MGEQQARGATSGEWRENKFEFKISVAELAVRP